MKKILFAICAFLSLTGCSAEDTGHEVQLPKLANVAVDAVLGVTATSYSDGLKSGFWDVSDCLGVYLRRTIDGVAYTTIDNLKYTNSGEALSSTARFVSTASFNICSGDVFVGYYPYSAEQDIVVEGSLDSRTATASVVRPFSLGVQTQEGNNSTAHIGALDFLVATPVAVSDAMLAEAPDVVVPFTFKHAFAAVKFELKNEFSRQLRIQKITVKGADGTALTGDYAIDIVTPEVMAVKPLPTAELNVVNAASTAVNDSFAGYMIVNATMLAAGTVLTVSTSAGTFETVTVADIELNRGEVNTIAVALNADRLAGGQSGVSLDNCMGDWRLASFCGATAELDIYMTIRADGTFTLYQRNADYTPVRFAGNYAFDANSSLFSGRYSDGAAWANSYIVDYADGETMTWINAANDAEVSVYIRSDIPASMLGATRGMDVNTERFL